MQLSVSRLAPVCVIACELLGITSLYFAPEMNKGVFWASIAAAAVLFAAGLRLKDKFLLPLLGAVIAFSLIAVFMMNEITGSSISRGVLIMHLMLWLSARTDSFRFWRVGLAFLEIILASILSPEAHMFLIIFAFIMLSSFALSLGFLEEKFRRHDPRQLDSPLKGSILSAVVVFSFLIFLSSLLIFPILPRSNFAGLGRNWVEVGYTEVINFEDNGLAWGAGNSRPMVWLFLPNGESWQDILPLGLVRGKVLEKFTAQGWLPASKQTSLERGEGGGAKVEFFREPMNTDVLPVPYGASIVKLDGKEHSRHISGEYPAYTYMNKRIQYEVELGQGRGQRNEPPKRIHKLTPEPETFPELISLANRLSAGTRTDLERIRNVVRHLDGYRATLKPAPPSDSRTHPVERFLTETKRGHCEMFATAAALMFRSMGIPSRLVAGFRGRYPDGAVMVLKNTDAHAWVEVWTNETGWMPIDVTPVIDQNMTWLEKVLEKYEYLNAYWHHYILGYEFDWSGKRRWWQKNRPHVFSALGALIAFALVFFGWRRFLGVCRRRRTSREIASDAWRRLESSLSRIGASQRSELTELEAWQTLSGRYQRLRFGRNEPSEEEIRLLLKEGKELIQSFAKSSPELSARP